MDRVRGVAIVGCGLIGTRRARTAAAHAGTRVVAVVDIDGARRNALAETSGGRPLADWRDALADEEVDVVVVATPNALLAEVAIAALGAGKDVLMEKPMGRDVAEAERVAEAAGSAGTVLKVGFNHRYHPALARAHELVGGGAIGPIINVRARYGHGGRPGFEAEWRADPDRAGGGHLTDQGVHVVDLLGWFVGLPDEAFAFLQTAVWPIEPLEDNAFGLFRWSDGAVAQLHVSMTQWKNLFSLELFGERGSLAVNGLGGSYGTERLTLALRRPEGGVPELTEEAFPGTDPSWRLEWADFVDGLAGDGPVHGTVDDGLRSMRMLDALYRSHEEGGIVRV